MPKSTFSLTNHIKITEAAVKQFFVFYCLIKKFGVWQKKNFCTLEDFGASIFLQGVVNIQGFVYVLVLKTFFKQGKEITSISFKSKYR